jgi:hypothetical protein
MDWLHELAIIRLLDSVEANGKSVLNKQMADAARRRLKAMSSTPGPANVDRQRLVDGLRKRLHEFDARRRWAEKENAASPEETLANEEHK